MASRRPGRLRLVLSVAFLGFVTAGMTSFAPPAARRGPGRPALAHAVESVVVRRMDLDTMILAGGDLLPSKQTTVTCEVEDVDRGMESGETAGTVILSIVPNGAVVKKGDVLCVLDSSGFSERVRQEQIEVESARAEHRKVELTLETARSALREYREGLLGQRTREFETRLVLLDSDLHHQRDYVAWADRMLDKGYYSRGPVVSARQALARLSHERSVVEHESRVFRLFTAPKEIREIESQIEGAQASLGYQAMRLKSEEDRLALLQKQAENVHDPGAA